MHDNLPAHHPFPTHHLQQVGTFGVAAQVYCFLVAARLLAQFFFIHRLPGDAQDAQLQRLGLRKLELDGERKFTT